MTIAMATRAAQPGSPVTIHLLDDDSALGRPYIPVGDWKGPDELAVTLRVALDEGSTVDTASLRSEVQGNLIRLYFSTLKPSKLDEKAGDAETCKPYIPGAELVYLLHVQRGEYLVQLLGSHPADAAPLQTLQLAQSEGLPRIFEATVPKSGPLMLGGGAISLDDMDSLFTRAEPYQIPVDIESDDTSALDVQRLAEEHGLPYRFPNYDKLLMRSADEAVAQAEAFTKVPHPHIGSWHAFGSHSKLPLSISLSLPGPALTSGAVPQFTVTVRNDGASPLRLADIKRHPGLMANYLDILLTQGSQRVRDIPVAIADAGPSSQEDFALLQPDESFSVDYSGFPLALDHLKPGTYQATLYFYFDEMYTRRYVVSKTISFQVQ